MKRIICFALVVMLLASVLCMGACSSGTGLGKGKSYIYSADRLAFSVSGDKVYSLTYKADDGYYADVEGFEFDQYAVDSGVVYAVSYDGLAKYNVGNDGICEREIITISPEVLNAWGKSGEFDVDRMHNMCINDGKLYFRYTPDFYGDEDNIKMGYKILYLTLDGQSGGVVDGITCGYFTICGDYIYYLDNGYIIDEDARYTDYSSVGIYRIKLDGTEKELIFADPSHEQGFASYLPAYFAEDFRTYGDNVYYIDNTETGAGRVCRIDTKTLETEYISTEIETYSYALDEKGETIYCYCEPPREDGAYAAVYSTKIADKATTELFKVTYTTSTLSLFSMEYNDGHLYFWTTQLNSGGRIEQEDVGTCGVRYNVKENISEALGRKSLDYDNASYDTFWVEQPCFDIEG